MATICILKSYLAFLDFSADMPSVVERKPVIRAAIFDLMGTVAVSTQNDEVEWLSYLYSHLAGFGLNAREEQLMIAWDASETRPSESGYTPFEERIHRVAFGMELHLSWAGVTSIANAICLRSAGFLEVDPDAFVLLGYLQEKMHTPLVTNFDHPPEVYRFLSAAGLEEMLRPVIISGEIGVWKPDPRVLNAALRAICVKPDEALYVGDSRVDVEAALAAGVIPVLVARQDGYADPFRAPEESVEIEYADLIRQKRVRVVRRLTEVADMI